MRSAMGTLLTVDEARRRILERATPLPSELVSLADAAGRVLAQAARAAVDLPPFPSSAMDGFALRAADAPGRLPVVARVAAGHPAPRPLAPGEAMAIATGGVVPEGADAVVPIEIVTDDGETVEVPAVERGAHVRPRGGDLAGGDIVVEEGKLLRAAELAALAAAGVADVTCARRPRVALVTTGSELRRPGAVLAPGQIYESNGVMLAAAITSAGALVDLHVSVADDEHEHRDALARGLAADVLITSGGVSVGPHDLVRRIEEELGVEEVFWRVAVKPGKPISFGVRGGTLVFGLPGNPVSSLVGFELFVRPALLALQGAREPGPALQPGVLASSVRRNAQRDEFLRARVRSDGDRVVLEPLTGQESHMIARAAAADALVLAPRGEGELEAGSGVRYLLLR
jgi:molybdopterin molybdotransferase